MSSRLRTYRFAGCVALVLSGCGDGSEGGSNGAPSSAGSASAPPRGEVTHGSGGSKSKEPTGFFKDASSIPGVVRASAKGRRIRLARLRITDRTASVVLTVDGGPLQICSLEPGRKECILHAASEAQPSDELMMDLDEVRFDDIPKAASRDLGVDVPIAVEDIVIERTEKGATPKVRAIGGGGKFY